MKTQEINTKSETVSTPAAGFQTPHEKAQQTTPKLNGGGKGTKDKAKNSKSKKETKKGKQSAPVTAKVGKDAWGGRLTSRMSKINQVVIKAGGKGAIVTEVAKATGESTSIVSAQLGWAVSKLKVATRKQETIEGKQVWRYFSKSATPSEKPASAPATEQPVLA